MLERYLGGDVRAFDQIMAAHEDRVFSVCLRIMSNRDAALDAVQETFLTVFRKAGQFKGESALSTWIYRVAVNTCYDQLRKQNRQRTEALPEGREPPDPASEARLTSAELRPDIERALNTLTEEFRGAVVLSDVEGLPLQTVADALDVPLGTVKSRVFRGRRLLAETLGNFRDPSRHQSGDDHD